MNQNSFLVNIDQDEFVNMYLAAIEQVFSGDMNRGINQETPSPNMVQEIKLETLSPNMDHNIGQGMLSPVSMDHNIGQGIHSPVSMDLHIKQETVISKSPDSYQSIKLETFSPDTYQNTVYTNFDLESPIQQDPPCAFMPEDFDIAQAYNPSVFTDVYDLDMHAQQLAQFNALKRNPALF